MASGFEFPGKKGALSSMTPNSGPEFSGAFLKRPAHFKNSKNSQGRLLPTISTCLMISSGSGSLPLQQQFSFMKPHIFLLIFFKFLKLSLPLLAKTLVPFQWAKI
jgi:hypothetical protein